MAAFVLLWGSAAIVTRLALNHASVFVVLILRFALALVATVVIALHGGRLLPPAGTRWPIASTGVLLLGLLLALAGLVLVVLQSLLSAKLSGLGIGFALGALLCTGIVAGLVIVFQVHRDVGNLHRVNSCRSGAEHVNGREGSVAATRQTTCEGRPPELAFRPAI